MRQARQAKLAPVLRAAHVAPAAGTQSQHLAACEASMQSVPSGQSARPPQVFEAYEQRLPKRAEREWAERGWVDKGRHAYDCPADRKLDVSFHLTPSVSQRMSHCMSHRCSCRLSRAATMRQGSPGGLAGGAVAAW